MRPVQNSGIKQKKLDIFSDFRFLWFFLSVIFVILGLVKSESITGFFLEDKLIHATGFMILVMSFREGFKRNDFKSIFSVTLGLGGLVEFLQIFVPYRQASIMDLVADLTGGLMVYFIPEWLMGVLWRWVASFFGIGYLWPGPGTLASLVTLFVFYFSSLEGPYILVFAYLAFIIGIYVSSKFSGKDNKDPRWIVIDEVCGMLIALAFVPKKIGPVILAFLLFRFFDIKKPFGLKRAEKLPGGLGIMADDALSGLVSGFLTWSILKLLAML